jgi:hypothetical protein
VRGRKEQKIFKIDEHTQTHKHTHTHTHTHEAEMKKLYNLAGIHELILYYTRYYTYITGMKTLYNLAGKKLKGDKVKGAADPAGTFLKKKKRILHGDFIVGGQQLEE